MPSRGASLMCRRPLKAEQKHLPMRAIAQALVHSACLGQKGLSHSLKTITLEKEKSRIQLKTTGKSGQTKNRYSTALCQNAWDAVRGVCTRDWPCPRSEASPGNSILNQGQSCAGRRWMPSPSSVSGCRS